MKIKVSYKRVPHKVTFVDADNIDRTRLAEALGVSVSMVSLMIRTGRVPKKFIPVLRKIPLEKVKTLRKPTVKP